MAKRRKLRYTFTHALVANNQPDGFRFKAIQVYSRKDRVMDQIRAGVDGHHVDLTTLSPDQLDQFNRENSSEYLLWELCGGTPVRASLLSEAIPMLREFLSEHFEGLYIPIETARSLLTFPDYTDKLFYMSVNGLSHNILYSICEDVITRNYKRLCLSVR